eukprot:scaffold47099_cov66-Phaeocystis_antarctica.AAC.2
MRCTLRLWRCSVCAAYVAQVAADVDTTGWDERRFALVVFGVGGPSFSRETRRCVAYVAHAAHVTNSSVKEMAECRLSATESPRRKFWRGLMPRQGRKPGRKVLLTVSCRSREVHLRHPCCCHTDQDHLAIRSRMVDHTAAQRADLPSIVKP